MPKSVRVFITGEAGLLAHAISDVLPYRYKLIGKELPDYLRRCISEHHGQKEIDILNPNLGEYMRAACVDLVIHCAAIVNTDKCLHSPIASIDTNMKGTWHVLEACKRAGARLVYVSTTATYKPGLQNYYESSPQCPRTIYGITKYAGELIVSQQSEVPFAVIRPCFIFGDAPLDHSSQLTRIAVHSALKACWPKKASKTLAVTLDPNSLKDYMRVEDFAAAVVSLLECKHDIWGETFNISGQHPRLVKTYFDQLQHYLKHKLDFFYQPNLDYMGNHLVNSDKLREWTGWAPKINVLTDGLSLTARAAIRTVSVAKKDGGPLWYI